MLELGGEPAFRGLHKYYQAFRRASTLACAVNQSAALRPATRNLRQNAELVNKLEEIRAGRLLAPLPSSAAALCHTSPIGLIPKPNRAGEWRLMVNLSAPAGASVNEAINPDLCSF